MNWRSCASGARSAEAFALLFDTEVVDVHFEQMIHADAVRAVGLRARLGRRVDDGSVDDVVDLVGADAYFEGVGRLAVGSRLLDGVVRRLLDDVRRHVALAL